MTWQLVATEQTSRLTELLKEGWEPFAVTYERSRQGQDRVNVVWLRKQGQEEHGQRA